MRRRVVLIVAGLAVLAAGAVALIVHFQLKSPISWENAARVRPGMTRREVETILGGPGVPGTAASRVWAARGVWVHVGFDERGAAVWGQLREEPAEP